MDNGRQMRATTCLSAAFGVALLGAAPACGGSAPRPAAPSTPAPAPILADVAEVPGTAADECALVVRELERYGRCGLLDDDRRWYLARWREQVATDLALAESPHVGDEAKRQLAVSCHKAALALTDAATRCAAEAAARAPQPGAPGDR